MMSRSSKDKIRQSVSTSFSGQKIKYFLSKWPNIATDLIILLLPDNKTSKSHYILVRDLSRLVAGRTKAHDKAHVEVATPTDWNSIKRLSWPGSTRLFWPGSARLSDLVRQGFLDPVREGQTRDWDWTEKKVTTTRQSRQCTERSVEWRPTTLVVLVRLELSSTRRRSLLRLSTRSSLAVPGALNRMFSGRRWTQCSLPGLDGCRTRLGRSERFDRRLNISTDIWTCWDYLHGPLPRLLRAINWVNITD